MLDNKPKSLSKVFWNGIHISITHFIFGYTIGVFNTSQENVSYSMGWSSSEETLYVNLFSTFIPLGAFFGSSITAFLSNNLGRLKTVLILDSLTFVGSVLSVFPITAVFGIGRFLCGVSCGMSLAIGPNYISEMTPNSLMGMIGPLMALMLSVGLTLAYSLSFVLPDENFSQSINEFWRFMFVVPAIVALYQAGFFLFRMKHDTPLFYLRRKNVQKYKIVLLSIFEEKDIPTDEDLQIYLKSNQLKDEESFKSLFCDKSKSKMLRIGIILAVFQQFSGINAVIFYSFTIYQEIGLSVLEAKIFSVSIGLTYFISSILTIIILKCVSRKASLIYGHSLICMILILMGLISQFASHMSYFIAVLIIIYIGLFNFGLSATLWSYIGEIQTERAISVTVSFNYLANIVINYAFPISLSIVEIYYIFYFFGLCMLFATIYAKLDTIETTEKSKVKVQIEFTTKNGYVVTHECENLSESHK